MVFLHKPNTPQGSIQECSGRRCATSRVGFRQDAPLIEWMAPEPDRVCLVATTMALLVSQSSMSGRLVPLSNHHFHARPHPPGQNVTVSILIFRVTCVPYIEFGIVGLCIRAAQGSSAVDIPSLSSTRLKPVGTISVSVGFVCGCYNTKHLAVVSPSPPPLPCSP